MRPSLSVLLLCVAATVLGGCVMGSAGHNTDLLIDPQTAHEIGFAVGWTRDLGVAKDRSISSIKLLDDLIVVVVEPGNLVTAISVRNGQNLWHKIVGIDSEHLYAPVRSGERLYINSDSRMYRLDARSGRIESFVPLHQAVGTGPKLVNNLAIFGSLTGKVFAQNLDSGAIRWDYKLPAKFNTPPIQVGSNVFAADSSGRYAMLTADRGELLWAGRTFGGVSDAPAVDHSSIYLASADRAMYALNLNNGLDKWPPHRASQALTTGPRTMGRIVFLTVPGEGTEAIDAIDGQFRWRLPVEAHPLSMNADQILMASTASLLNVEHTSGRVSYRAPTALLSTVLNGPDNSIILVSPRGQLTRLNSTRLDLPKPDARAAANATTP